MKGGRSIDIIGPYPPPFGGISVHICRIEQLLIEKKIRYRIFNHSYHSGPNVFATNKSGLWYIKYLFKKKAPLIHFHHFFTFHYLYFLALTCFSRSKLIVTIHGEDILKYSRLKTRCILFLLKITKFQTLLVVSHQLSDYLSDMGIENLWLPAYVPPRRQQFVRLQSLVKKKYFIFSIWKLDRAIASKVYNIELAFQFLSQVKDNFQMLFLIGSEKESDKSYLEQLLNSFQVKDSVTIVYEKQLVDYLPNCEFLLRTNNEDGYGVSLQEALDLRVPAIATDVCIRPKGTILFRRGDIDDLLLKVERINDLWDENSIDTPCYHEQLLELYKDNL